MDGRDGLPRAVVPERLDRPLRLGPFTSGRDLLKFLAAAALGSVVGLELSAGFGVAVVLAGAVVALWRPNGEPLDAQATAVARWAARRGRRGVVVTGPRSPGDPVGPRSVVEGADRSIVAIVRTGGIPLAFLPPTELARQFDLYRTLLRSLEHRLTVHASSSPIYAGGLLPPPGRPTEAELAPRAGYADLVGLIARRRSIRRVHLALHGSDLSADGRARLETAVALLCARLEELGAPVERLRDRPLREAAWRIGYVGGRAG